MAISHEVVMAVQVDDDVAGKAGAICTLIPGDKYIAHEITNIVLLKCRNTRIDESFI